MQEKASYSMSRDPVDIHEALNTVRQSDEFQSGAQSDPFEQLRNHPQVREFLDDLQSTLESMIDAIRNFFSELPVPQANADNSVFDEIFLYAFFGILILIALALFYGLLVILRRVLMHRKKAKLPPRVTVEGVLLESSQVHRSRAADLARQNLFGPAIHQLYLSALCLLDESRRVPFEPYRTNGEYLDEPGLMDAPEPARAGFATVARRFEAAHYGRQLPVEEDYQSCTRSLDALATQLSGQEGAK